MAGGVVQPVPDLGRRVLGSMPDLEHGVLDGVLGLLGHACDEAGVLQVLVVVVELDLLGVEVTWLTWAGLRVRDLDIEATGSAWTWCATGRSRMRSRVGLLSRRGPARST